MAHSTKTKSKISESLKRYHAKKGKWIKGAIKNPGALRRKAKRLGMIKGDDKLTKIDLNKLEHSRNPTTRKEAQLADTLSKLRPRKKAAKKGFQ